MTAPTGSSSSFWQAFVQDPAKRRLVILVARVAGLVVMIAALALLATQYLGQLPVTADGYPDFEYLLGQVRDSAWAPAVVVTLYILLNFAGIPQVLLMGATVIVFGPWYGFAYAWGATMASSSVGYILGKMFGGELLRRYGSDRVNRLSRWLAKRGILSSALVRFVPAGPAIMVNMICGASHIRYWQFALGTGMGIVPKILLVAGVSDYVMKYLDSGDTSTLVGVGLWFAAIGAFFLLSRWLMRRWREGRTVEAGVSAEPGASHILRPEDEAVLHTDLVREDLKTTTMDASSLGGAPKPTS